MFEIADNKKHLENILNQLREEGARSICIYFDGSGDEGAIQGVNIYKEDYIRFEPTFEVSYATSSIHWEDGKRVDKVQVKTLPVSEALENFCYEVLEKTNIDWYNNDGGYGEMQITLDPVEIKLEVNERYTEVTTHSFDITTDMEVKDEV